MSPNERLLSASAKASWAAAALLAVCGGGWILSPVAFYQAWLFGWLYWFGVSLGALVLLMLRALTGGAWGRAIRAPCEAAMPTVPAMAVLFLPVLVGLDQIYPWTDRAIFEHHEWPHKAGYYTLPFFLIRAAIVLAIFITLALLVRGWSQNRPGWSPEHRQLRLRQISCAGLVLYFLCMNFAATDWIMSLNPAFFSSIFPTIVMVSQFLSALAVFITILCGVSSLPAFRDALVEKQFHDLGKLLLAFVAFWTYVSFSQFLLIWSGNLPPEISWYRARASGGWPWLAVALAILQFFVPFALLLSRDAKKNPRRLGWIAALVALGGAVNVFWLVAPSFHPAGFHLSWLDPIAFAAIGAVWAALFLRSWALQPALLSADE